ATSRTLQTTQSGTYRVIVSDGTCINISDDFAFVYEGTSVSEDEGGRGALSITPIPVVDELTVNLPARTQRTLEIVDLSGRVLYRGSVADDVSVFQTSTAAWSSGAYIVQVRSASGIWTATFVKQ
ncbi:MAG: T9SS type A sorting domain-containing protein, partial [Candidatus Kapabacteria bacterium]|nr:T9SS type A sorting domain-containing protein [Candidatus Kapabacteria bacterium]